MKINVVVGLFMAFLLIKILKRLFRSMAVHCIELRTAFNNHQSMVIGGPIIWLSPPDTQNPFHGAFNFIHVPRGNELAIPGGEVPVLTSGPGLSLA